VIAPPTPKSEPAPLPRDEALPGLLHVLDTEWALKRHIEGFGRSEEPFDAIRPVQLIYRPGRRAIVAYVAERRWDDWLIEERFAIELHADRADRIFRYPDDPYLPGLAPAANAAEAQSLISKHTPLRPQRLSVELVRYRPGGRAVLRHVAGWRGGQAQELSLYARVMAPQRVQRLVAAAAVSEHSGLTLPRIAGCWEEGGITWLTEVPGETLRSRVRAGTPPNPEAVLEPLAQLWATPPDESISGFDLPASFEWTERLLSIILTDKPDHTLRQVAAHLRPFADSWHATAIAHNDFYDDQVVVTPSGALALVDFEEAGPGDPLLDVGNLLAHLRWMSRAGREDDPCTNYRESFSEAALARFGWAPRDLALREAFGLFRLSTNPFRQLRRDWPGAVQRGLKLALQALDQA
jgi:hypothetical protein